MKFERPKFLGKGVFQWNALGYRYADSPPANLLEEGALSNANPWLAMAAVLERAKTGDFSRIDVLTRCLRDSDSWVLAQDCAELLGDAAPGPALREAVEAFNADLFEDDDIRYQVYFAYALYNAALLWVIPIVVRIYMRIRESEESEIIPILLSYLLEEESGPVAGVNQHATIEDYEKFVLGLHDQIVLKVGTDSVAVINGETLDIRAVATRLRAELMKHDANVLLIRRLRHRLEAATGLDCSSFFRSGLLQPLAACAVVEDFLEGTDADGYEPGVRYFHGHRIPE